MPRFEDIPAPPNSPTLNHPCNIRCWPSDKSDFANVLTSIPNPPPNGTCTPNGLPWSHSPRDFFKIVLPHSEPDPLRIPRDVIWSRSMIEEAWGKDAFVKCGPAKDEADEDVHAFKPRVKRPWPVLGISANHRANHYEGDLGVIDEGSDHDGQFEMRADDDQYGESQKDGEEMLREIHNLVAYDRQQTDPPKGPSSNTPDSASTRINILTTDSLDEAHFESRFPNNEDVSDGGGLIENDASQTPDVLSGGLQSEGESMVHKNGGLSNSLAKDEKGTDDVNGCMGIIDTYDNQPPKTPNGPRENLGPFEISAMNAHVHNIISHDVRTASKGPNAEDKDVDMNSGDGCAVVHVDGEAMPRTGDQNNKDIGIMNAANSISNEQLASPSEGLRDDVHCDRGSANGVRTEESSKPFGSSFHHDATSTGMGRLPAFEHVHENDDGKETDAGKFAALPNDPPACQERHVSPPCEAAIGAPTATTANSSDPPWFDGPKLEEWIPEAFLPEVLVVYDPDGVSSFGSTKPPMKIYKRFLPKPTSTRQSTKHNTAVDDDPSKEAPTAQLFLRKSACIGAGNHSYVYRAFFRLPTPLYARDSPHNMVSVAAKLSTSHWTERHMLNHEAHLYAGFEKHLAEEWCGFNKVDGVTQVVEVKAVVPKFYGYYITGEASESVEVVGRSGEARLHNTFHGQDSPVLLLEDCGKPVDPQMLTRDQRIEMYSLFARLHHAKILQQSPGLRNMVMQPGPLTLPPHQRSTGEPCFRIIDFGRGEVQTYLDHRSMASEKKDARKGLHLEDSIRG